MDDLAMYLHEMGLSEYEAAAYLALLSKGTATAKEVASSGEIPQSRVYDVLEKLETKGFVVIQPGRPKKFGANEPARAVKQFGEYKEERFEAEYEGVMEAGSRLVDSVEQSNIGGETPQDQDIVWSYSTEHALFEVFGRLCRETTAELRMITRADSIERKVGRLDEDLSALDQQGVRLRVLIPQQERVSDVVVDRLTEYAEVRHGTRIEAQMYIFDDADVLIAFPQQDQYVGFTVQSRALGQTLIHMFEELWKTADR